MSKYDKPLFDHESHINDGYFNIYPSAFHRYNRVVGAHREQKWQSIEAAKTATTKVLYRIRVKAKVAI